MFGRGCPCDVVCIITSPFTVLGLCYTTQYCIVLSPTQAVMFCVRGSFRRSTKQYVYKYACRLCGKPCDNDATKAIFILPRRHLSSETHTAQLETANEHGIIFEGAADETNFTKSAGHTLHTPVLLREVLQVIQPKNDQVWRNRTCIGSSLERTPRVASTY